MKKRNGKNGNGSLALKTVTLTPEEKGVIDGRERVLLQLKVRLADVTVQYERAKATLVTEIAKAEELYRESVIERAGAHGIDAKDTTKAWTYDGTQGMFTRTA